MRCGTLSSNTGPMAVMAAVYDYQGRRSSSKDSSLNRQNAWYESLDPLQVCL